MLHTGSIAAWPSTERRDRVRPVLQGGGAVCVGRPDLGEHRQGDLRRGARADVQAGRRVDARDRSASVSSQLGQHRRGALAAGDERDVRHPGLDRAVSTSSPRRARARRPRPRWRPGRSLAPGPARGTLPADAPPSARARATGRLPVHEHQGRGDHRLQEDLERAAGQARVGDRDQPLRPVRRPRRPSRGVMRSRADSPVSRAAGAPRTGRSTRRRCRRRSPPSCRPAARAPGRRPWRWSGARRGPPSRGRTGCDRSAADPPWPTDLCWSSLASAPSLTKLANNQSPRSRSRAIVHHVNLRPTSRPTTAKQ